MITHSLIIVIEYILTHTTDSTLLHGSVEFVYSNLTSTSPVTNSSSSSPSTYMSNPEQAIPELKTITGTKRKGEPTYDELSEEIKRVRASLKDSRIQYNTVVKKFNILWRSREKVVQEYSDLADKYQGALLDNKTLRSINFHSD